MEKFFSFSGRIGRYEYWIWSFGLVGLVIGAFALEAVMSVGLFAFVGVLAYFIGSLSLQVRRWHDRDKSGAWILINFVPFIGTIWSFIELGFIEGTPGPNKYGWPYGMEPGAYPTGHYPAGMAPMRTAPEYQMIGMPAPVQQQTYTSKHICASCGDANEPDNRFCGKCGSRIQAPSVQPGEIWNPSRI